MLSSFAMLCLPFCKSSFKRKIAGIAGLGPLGPLEIRRRGADPLARRAGGGPRELLAEAHSGGHGASAAAFRSGSEKSTPQRFSPPKMRCHFSFWFIHEKDKRSQGRLRCVFLISPGPSHPLLLYSIDGAS